MVNKKVTLLLFSILAAAAPLYSAEYELPPPPGDSYIYFNADKLDYNADARTISLLGNVSLLFTSPNMDETRFYANNLIIDQNTSTIFSNGPVRAEQDSGVFNGQDIEYNYDTKDLKIKNISAVYPPIRILNAKSAEVKDGRQVYKGAEVTCCDVEKPHYYLKVGSVSMSPEKRIFGTNALLYLSDIPVFYLPVFWRSLAPQQPFTTYVDFSQSNKTGFGLLTSTVFYPIPQLRATVNLDGYLKSGIGYGGQLLVKDTEKVKGTAEAYAINDNVAGTFRWGVTGSLWAQLFDSSDQLNREDGGAIYTNQSQFRSVSDPYFNDTFFRSDPFKFMPDQDINFAFSRQTRKSITRISYSQQDLFDTTLNKYVTQQKTLPSFDYQLMPFTLPLGLVNNFSANISNTEILNQGFTQTASAVYRTQRSFKINRTFTFVPYATLDERLTFGDQFSDENSYVTRLGGGGNLRANLITGSLDVSYNYLKRFSTGTLQTDTISPDGGIESNKVYIQNYYRPTPFLYVRLGTGYNVGDNSGAWTYGERWDPLLGEIGYNAQDGSLNLFAQEQYDVNDGNKAFIMQSDFNLFRQSRGLLGMTNHANDPNSYLINSRLWFRPAGLSWSFDAGMDFEIKQGMFSAYSKSLMFYKEFHDAGIMVGVVDRNENLSFNFRVNVYCGKNSRKNATAPEDNFWYPWRRPGDFR
ncbi:MAG: LPS export ABC transporter periplasmic protein LptC [Elusimicrobia bacterium]|nr:LPS export ABC transporter periplasmic protein LptC [Elusimicrobiota bacterium]